MGNAESYQQNKKATVTALTNSAQAAAQAAAAAGLDSLAKSVTNPAGAPNVAGTHYDTNPAGADKPDGASYSTAGGEACDDAFRRFMKVLAKEHGANYQAAYERTSGILGAGDCGCEATGGRRRGYFNGGSSKDSEDSKATRDLHTYEESLSAKTKEEVIRRIATALSRAGINVDPNADSDTVIKSLVENIPGPKNGKTFSDSSDAQKKVCRVIATVFNDVFTPGATRAQDMFIDTSMNPVDICRTVADWAQSFSHGVNTEFLNVYTSVKNDLRSIQILSEIMREAQEKIRKQVESSGDADLIRDSEQLFELFSRAQSERRKQEEMLKNILNINLIPAAKELELALRDDSETNAIIRRLGLREGTSEFAKGLAYTISGIGTTANVANRINNALKKVGVTVRDYLDSKDFKDFEALVNDNLMKSPRESDNLKQFLTAANVLNTNFKNREEFRTALEVGATGGARHHETSRKQGGDYDPDGNYVYRSAMDKRVQKTKTEKAVISKEFARRVSKHYDEIIAAIKAIGPELGIKIPLNDSTEYLRDTLIRLRDMREQKIELSLLGLNAGADYRAKKEMFVNRIRQVAGACEHLMTLETFRGVSQYFARLKTAIDDLAKTIDYFSDVIVKKFGGDEESSADDAHVGGAEDLEIARSSVTLGEAVSDFIYFYYVANVRENLKQSSEELEVFGEKYENLLGDAVAIRLWHLRKKYNDSLTTFETEITNDKSETYTRLQANTTEGKARCESVKKFMKDDFTTLEKFYKALQAIDLYLKAFTSGIVSDPDAVRDIKKMLDGTQVIARWFDEETGDNLWKAFESTSTFNFQTNAPTGEANTLGKTIIDDKTDNHYYEKVKNATGSPSSNPMVYSYPYSGMRPESSDAEGLGVVKKRISDAVDHFQALKNLINAFSRIGDYFGGKEIKSQIFMSPTQIYKALVDFIKVKSLVMTPHNTYTREIVYNEDGSVNTTIPDLKIEVSPAGPTIKSYEVQFASSFMVNKEGVKIEYRYFTCIIKSMAAKIMTTIGVYDMFERQTPIYTLTPTRMIIGGSVESVEVIEGASELYFRLPRLAEFYRSVLFKGIPQITEGIKIAMIPEVEGVFSGLINIIFQKFAGALDGDYTDSEMRTIIQEVNKIYLYFKESSGEEKCVKAAMNSLVKEINRRYGIVKNKEMKDYLDLVKRQKNEEEGFYNHTNYAILPGEEDITVSTRLAPSDRFTATLGLNRDTSTGVEPKEFKGRVRLDIDTTDEARSQLLTQFRMTIDNEFRSIDPKMFGKVSYNQLIKRSREKIRKSQTNPDKLSAAMELIQSSSTVGVESSRALMFHETVVVGLNVLYAIYGLIENFDASVKDHDAKALELALQDVLYSVASSPLGAITSVADFNAALALLPAEVKSKISNQALRFITDNDGTAGKLIARGHICNDMDLYAYIDLECRHAATNMLDKYPSLMTPDEHAAITSKGDNIIRTYAAFNTASRLLVDYPKMMKSFIETLFAFGNDNSSLVEVKFTNNPTNPIHISASKLKDFVEATLSEIKNYMDIFRSTLSPEVINRFEDKDKVGSIYWLEKNLLDKRIKGIDEDNQLSPESTVDAMFKRANKVFKYYTASDKFALGNDRNNSVITAANLTTGNNLIWQNAKAYLLDTNKANKYLTYESYGNSIAAMLWYGIGDMGSLQAVELNALVGLQSLVRKDRISTNAEALAAGKLKSTRGVDVGRFPLYNNISLNEQKSLMFLFNQLLYMYLDTVVDNVGNKVYTNLINAFANGVASRAVSDPTGASFPDLAEVSTQFNYHGNPADGVVVFQSIAYILQRLIKDVNPTNQISDHLVNTLADIPLYMKERYRANLPTFIKLFNLIIQKGEFIRQLVQKTGINCIQIGILPGAADGVKIDGDVNIRYPTGALNALDDLRSNSGDIRQKIVSVIDSVTSFSYSVGGCASDVLKELADQPVYFQVQEKSIETYKLRYGKLPLMPLSFALHAIDGATNEARFNHFIPNKAQGSFEFKFQYGVRGLFNQRSSGYESMPGVKDILDTYNNSSTKREQIDTDRYLGFAQSLVSSLKDLTDSLSFKSYLSLDANIFNSAATALLDSDLTAYPLGKPIQTLINAVETSNQDDEIMKMVYSIDKQVTLIDRHKERILNIVDMNIIPINVHALMRDIPLANLYNYTYTFEKMIVSMYGNELDQFITSTTGEYKKSLNSAKNTKDAFLALLVNPYAEVNVDTYGSDVHELGTAGFVHRIFRGDNALGLGRPKFLSDQLFSKALFGNLYPGQRDFDEGGPGVGAGIRRGREMVGYNRTQQPLPESINYVLSEFEPLKKEVLGLEATMLKYLNANGNIMALFGNDGRGNLWINVLLDKYSNEVNNICDLVGHFVRKLNDIAQDLGITNSISRLISQIMNGTIVGDLDSYTLGRYYDKKGSFATSDRNNIIKLLLGFEPEATLAVVIKNMNAIKQRRCGIKLGNIYALERVVYAIRKSTVSHGKPITPTVDISKFRKRTSKLTYLKESDHDAYENVVEVNFSNPDYRTTLATVGRARFDTVLVRNMFFITNVLRIVRLKLNRELTHSRNVVVSSHEAVAQGITEYGIDPFSPNEVYESKLVGGIPKYRDEDSYN
jgi:hypothetical protein